MNFENKRRYEEKPYISKAYYNTQALQQNAVLKFMGLSNVDPKKSRILEIGSSYGGNIISYAMNFKDTEIIGIDLSETQVNAANKIIEKIGLKNIKFYNMDIMDYNNEFGKFDYIICHGVYSWVKDEVKYKILKVIKSSLTENGSAVISYNTYPGWRNFDIIKDIMKFRIKFLTKKGIEINSKNEVSYGRGSLDFIKEYSKNNEEISKYIDLIYSKQDYYIYHDFLEENNNPLYIYDFNKKLEKNGLTHVSDTNLSISNRTINDDKLLEALKKECGDNNVIKEQYYDYIFDTSFRYSLITHIERKDKISVLGKYNKKDLDSLYINAKFKKNANGEYILGEKVVLEEYLDFVKSLTEAYPNTLKIEDIIKKYGEKYYVIILNLIISKDINLFGEEINIDKNIKRIKLKKEYIDFLDIMLENYDKLVVSDIFGYNYSKDEVDIIKEFSTGKTYMEIYNEIKDNYNKEVFDDVFEKIYDRILISKQYEVLE